MEVTSTEGDSNKLRGNTRKTQGKSDWDDDRSSAEGVWGMACESMKRYGIISVSARL